MPLIDRSYFIGDINIPGTNKVDVQERLDWFIESHETQLLKDIFGYQFYAAFMQGLTGSPVPQVWTDLLSGTEYTDFNDRKQKWVGLVSQPLDLINALDASGAITVIVGRGQQYDPVADATSVLLPPSLVGKDFIVEQRAFGKLRADEYSIVGGNVLQLSGGKKFSNGDTYFYRSVTLALNTTTGSVKKSLIANYVYYQWQRDQFSQTVGLGEVATKAENAQVVSPALKMIRAYNEMVERIQELMYYLYVRQDDYPDWWVVQQNETLCRFRKLNSLGV